MDTRYFFWKDVIPMEQEANQFLGEENIGKLMRKYSIPCIISLLVGALYNIVDQIFIANASYLGSYGNAANTVVFPLTVITLAFAVMIGDGCCAFVSLSLGRKQSKTAKKSVGNSIIMVIASGLLLCAVYLIFSNQIIAMFGGTVNAETFSFPHILDPFFPSLDGCGNFVVQKMQARDFGQVKLGHSLFPHAMIRLRQDAKHVNLHFVVL